MIYYVRVQYTKYTEYPMGSVYHIDATDATAAEKDARSKYSSEYGFDEQYVTAKATYTCEAIPE